MDAAVLIPIKAFTAAKGRLVPVLSPPERERLARWTAARVLAAAGELPVFVACDSADVAEWATSHGAEVLWEEGQGLNGAVDHAVATLTAAGHAHVTVVHSDLPLPGPLRVFAAPGRIVLVPDQHLDGTNLMSFPLSTPVAAAYGAGSYRRHLASALATGISVEVVRDRFMALDIDHPADLSHPLVKDVLPTWLRTNPANPTAP